MNHVFFYMYLASIMQFQQRERHSLYQDSVTSNRICFNVYFFKKLFQNLYNNTQYFNGYEQIGIRYLPDEI